MSNRQRRYSVDRRRLVRAAARAYEAGAPGGRGGTIAILLAPDAAIRRLNRRHRGVDRSTDVLSFPDGEPRPDGGIHLGDVALSVETAARQAAAAGRSLAAALDRLTAHGVLHLLGYDHETDNGEMMALQGRILRALAREETG